LQGPGVDGKGFRELELATNIIALCSLILFACLLLFATSKLFIVSRKIERIVGALKSLELGDAPSDGDSDTEDAKKAAT